MTHDEAATMMATRVRASGRGFLTLKREELREVFGIGRLSEGQADSVSSALERAGILVHPHPFINGISVRLYLIGNPLGAAVRAVVLTDELPDTALRHIANVLERDAAGRNLRSDDAPWLRVFDVFLQAVFGRESEQWEEMRDDRHPVTLAGDLAEALALPRSLVDDPSTFRVAAAVCAFRPRRRWASDDFQSAHQVELAASVFAEHVESADRRRRDEHERLLASAARLLLRSETIPTHDVEVGCLGLRYRRELSARGTK
jgi:hypothetical protein